MEFSSPVHEARRAVNDSLTLRFPQRGCEKVPSIPPRPDHEILSQRRLARNVVSPRTQREANMPFLFWMPMIVMCGLWRAAEQDAQALLPPHR